MLYANLQGLQTATRQLLLHAGQRELPVLPYSLSQQQASVCGPLYPYGEPLEELRLPLLSQLQQHPQTGYDLQSAVRQVCSQPPRVEIDCKINVLMQLSDQNVCVFIFSVVYFLGYSVDELTGRSWYSLVHPEDLSLGADSHRSLSKYTIHCKNLNCTLKRCLVVMTDKFRISKTWHFLTKGAYHHHHFLHNTWNLVIYACRNDFNHLICRAAILVTETSLMKQAV